MSRAILTAILASQLLGCAVTYVNYADACAMSSQCCAAPTEKGGLSASR